MGSETRDKIDGVPLERWHERNVYHRQTIEARRSIQMKVFTGCVVLLLGLAKGGQDLLSGARSTEEVRIALILGALAVPVFLLLFMLEIESVNNRSREWYPDYERRLDGHLARGDGRAPVAQDPKPPDTGAVTNTQPQQGSGN